MIRPAGGGRVAYPVAAAALITWRRVQDRRRESIARACHELRGPLGAARLGVELGLREGELSADRLRAVAGELERASVALDDLQAARRRRSWGSPARSDPGLGRGIVELAPLLADSVQAWRPVAEAAGKELALGPASRGMAVVGERPRLAQVLGNLIANAIEHGGERVVVGAAVAGRVADRALVEVIDDGPGLPAPVAELARRARGGRGERGRGLAIALGLATAGGGRLAAAPVARGARLVLDLPLASGGVDAAARPLPAL